MNDIAARGIGPGKRSWGIGAVSLVVLATTLVLATAAPSANATIFCDGFRPRAGQLFCHGTYVTTITQTSVGTSNNHACASVRLYDGTAAEGWVCSNGATYAIHSYPNDTPDGKPWIKSNETWGNLSGGYFAF